ncbi:hypothetical protein HDU87_000689 [Geranomyces variabilis]|uniref:Uncharacterized protein n=1 Tax=Geranomyces variabilis TaxID=109894 RepID=A0AAD5XS74_9FUNG|nr:hypothetical protein HDU87_000689 [Geranomyces variabilis]
MVALGHVSAMDDDNNFSDDSDYEDSESASDHSSEFWSDEESEGDDEITIISHGMTLEQQARKVYYWSPEPPVESQHVELAEIAMYLMERKLLYPTIPDQLEENLTWLSFLIGSAYGEEWLAEYVRARRRQLLPIAPHLEKWYDDNPDNDDSAADDSNEYFIGFRQKCAPPGQWERLEDWMAEELYRKDILPQLGIEEMEETEDMEETKVEKRAEDSEDF